MTEDILAAAVARLWPGAAILASRLRPYRDDWRHLGGAARHGV